MHKKTIIAAITTMTLLGCGSDSGETTDTVMFAKESEVLEYPTVPEKPANPDRFVVEPPINLPIEPPEVTPRREPHCSAENTYKEVIFDKRYQKITFLTGPDNCELNVNIYKQLRSGGYKYFRDVNVIETSPLTFKGEVSGRSAIDVLSQKEIEEELTLYSVTMEGITKVKPSQSDVDLGAVECRYKWNTDPFSIVGKDGDFKLVDPDESVVYTRYVCTDEYGSKVIEEPEIIRFDDNFKGLEGTKRWSMYGHPWYKESFEMSILEAKIMK